MREQQEIVQLWIEGMRLDHRLEEATHELLERRVHARDELALEALVTLWREVSEGLVATVTETLARVTGAKPVSFDLWAAANAGAFR